METAAGMCSLLVGVAMRVDCIIMRPMMSFFSTTIISRSRIIVRMVVFPNSIAGGVPGLMSAIPHLLMLRMVVPG